MCSVVFVELESTYVWAGFPSSTEGGAAQKPRISLVLRQLKTVTLVLINVRHFSSPFFNDAHECCFLCCNE